MSMLMCIFVIGKVQGQTPSFTMTISDQNVTGACAGIGVTFTNTSTIDASKLKWDFNDNYTTTNVNSISHTYISGGTYTITLTNTETQAKATQTLTVYNNPSADFTLSESVVCVGSNITFTSTSTPANSPIQTYTWSFGDGNVTQTASSNTTYAYNLAGSFVPILTVRDNNGCAGSSPTNKQIKVNGSQLQSSFQANGTNFYSCSNTIDLQNTTNESGTSGITYLWNFGDNTSSTEKSPATHTYSTPGTYTISLQAAYAGITGCTPLYSHKVYIGKPQINFTTPQSICQNQSISLSATANINGIVTTPQDILWSVDNGGVINNDSTTVLFVNSGTTTLSATNKNGCPSPTAKQVNVLPIPIFSIDLVPNKGICIGMNTDASISVSNGLTINQYTWYPKGKDASVQDVTKVNSYSYAYESAGQYTYNVSATASNGCSAIQFLPVTIVQECIDNGYGSAYNPIFSFESADCNHKYTIVIKNKQPAKPVSYWQIGGTKYYAIGGQYSNPITLSPQTKGTIYSVSTYYTNGTSDLNRQITIIDETANFDIVNNDNATTYCANNRFSFKTDNYINTGNIASFSWQITDANNNIIQTSSSANMDYYFPAAGKYSVTLTIADVRTPSCSSTITKPLQIYGLGGDFTADATSFCIPNPNVTFQSKIIVGPAKLSNLTWHFGDGTTASFDNPSPNNNVTHQYTTNNASYNAFGITLRASDAMGCYININKWGGYIQIFQPKIGLSSQDTLVCNTKNIVINNLSDAANATYTWTVGNVTQTTHGNQPFNYNFSNAAIPSELDVKLHLVDGGGCTKDTSVSQYIRFRSPSAKYTISNRDALYNCPPFTLTIKNTSQNYDSIHWSINQDFNSIQKDSFYYTVLHPGPVSITLNAILDGCKDSYNENYLVKGPVAKLLTDDTGGCTPYTSLLYVSDNSDIVSYQWDKGDGITYITDKTSDSMRFTYDKAGIYYPAVTFIGKEGCSDKQQYPSPIVVQQSVDLKYQSSYNFCLNDTLLNITVSANAVSYSWSQDPTTGYMNGTTGPTIGIRPIENTTYHVFAKSGNVCPDESADIFVKTLVASEVSLSPHSITEPAGTVFNFTPTITHEELGVQYYWSPDYRINNRYLKSPTIIADNDTTYYLNIKNENGCVSSDSVHVKVLCNSSKLLMANAFTPNGDGKNDRFYVTGYGISNVLHFIIMDRWGNKVFERNNISSNDVSQGWDGTINGKQAAPGTYMYLAEVQCSEGNIIPLKGSVVLIR